MDQAQLNKLFDFGPNGGLTGKELGTLFGTHQFILILLQDSEQLQFLHATIEDVHTGKQVRPTRYWCGRDEKSITRLIEVLTQFSVQDISGVMKELNARILAESAV